MASVVRPPRLCDAQTPAPEESARARAREQYDRAEREFALGNFGSALGLYRDAYAMAPLPGFLFNIGQCQRNLNDLEGAIFSFRKYLVMAPEAADREAVEKLIARLERQLRAQREEAEAQARVRVATTPSAPPPERPVYKRTWFWVGVGTVLVAGGVATYFLLRAPDDGLGTIEFPK